MLEFWANFLETTVRPTLVPALRHTMLSDTYVLEICEDTWWGQDDRWILHPDILDRKDARFQNILDEASSWSPYNDEPLLLTVHLARGRRYFDFRTSLLNIACHMGDRHVRRPQRNATNYVYPGRTPQGT